MAIGDVPAAPTYGSGAEPSIEDKLNMLLTEINSLQSRVAALEADKATPPPIEPTIPGAANPIEAASAGPDVGASIFGGKPINQLLG